jgi:hypothetical protein
MNTDLWSFVIYRCIIGSRAYGLDEADSDTDRRGIYLPPAELHWSLEGVPEQLEDEAAQVCYWEMQKFITLALKANPNILECLYTPLIEDLSPLAEELLTNRHRFLSKQLHETYQRYVQSQFKKLEADLRNRGETRWKHAMHLIRLQMAGIHALREGIIQVDVRPHRAQLLQIKRGHMAWAEIAAWQADLAKTFDEAFTRTQLPAVPDYDWANAILIKARRSRVTLRPTILDSSRRLPHNHIPSFSPPSAARTCMAFPHRTRTTIFVACICCLSKILLG